MSILLDQINFPADLRKLKKNQLKQVSEELRKELINVVSETGGHLGAGLGVVELTVAIHYIFNTPKDKLVWDVGHQCYPHKIITGRKGMAVANKLSNNNNNVVAVIGDGAMSAGMAYEAMNNAGALKSRLIVILNDNEMSIAKPVGAMSKYLATLLSGKMYFSFRETVKMIISAFSKRFAEKTAKAEDLLKGLVTGGTLFSELGFYYIGPIDGHDVDNLVQVLENVKNSKHEGPVLIHAITQKGKGYKYAEESGDKYHGVSKFNVTTGEQVKSKSNTPSYTKIFAETLVKHAEQDTKIIGITGAMPSGTGMDIFQNRFPDRMFDVGIAEQHAVTFAAGLATEGYKPFAAIYSTFLQRAYDQVVHDVAIQSLPVRFAIDRAGLVGSDGPTHAGSFDITYLSTLPNFIVMAASDEAELVKMVNTAVKINDKPCAFRYPRGNGIGVELPNINEILEIGKGKIVRQGKQVAILCLGARLEECKKAAENLSAKEIELTIVDARFAKPLDEKLIMEVATTHEVLITIEEGSIGGFGSHVAQLLSDRGVFDKGLKFRSMILPDIFIDQDSPENMYKKAGLDSLSIVNKVEDITQASIASPIGTALIPTQGSCLPFTEILVFFPFLSIVFLLDNIEEVGLTENEATIS